MSKKKHKKTSMQKCMKKTRKFFVNGKPMSQTVHWSIIFGIVGVLLIKMTEMNNEIIMIQNSTSKILEKI